ncbi:MULTISPECIES: ABC transporter permease [Microbacterium]|uniref:ABC transporter permease n=1 Tax=Microbacterium aquimaris TaxID=459816 RepID=A0ABU5N409_9MICO|nr:MULTISPECIES: ABC transporter permease [Microbacterium]MDZ8160824.1 ABC transporter permease [Microbacterium aquimaris]MDZ8171177.1 ABC transporter permease [Microbacterium sp. KSW-48]MDZ8201694.1 ABC transporter permease [Microbacterium sp. SSW1-59]MDZ8275249.1 ABC transporter permease [Microbacterium aquimaris]
MLYYTLRRIPSAIVVLFLASIVIFFILRLVPGDPAVVLAGPDASPETVDAIRANLGLDQPLILQYLLWIGGVVTGDLGTSYILNASIGELMGEALANTAVLAGAAIILSLVFGGAVGIFLGVTRRKNTAALVGAVNSFAFAIPPYVVGLLLALVFSVQLGWLPSVGIGPGLDDPIGMLPFLVLPAVTLAIPTGATIARFLAVSMRQQRDEDFVVAATARGLRAGRLFRTHVLPNSLPPVLTIVGLQVANLLAGAILVEVIFAWPGVGQLILTSVQTRDYLLTQALLLLAVAVFITTQLLTDLADAAIDPRVRLRLAA